MASQPRINRNPYLCSLLTMESKHGGIRPAGKESAEEIGRRVRALRRLVPGGEEMEIGRLFEETAEYIEALEEKLGAMRALADHLHGLGKRKTKGKGKDF
ncbi:hypothetical protein HPP92_024299 [Vanilla planifolia]|uniref:Uncharacterized protein n=1 Tax=Vanilla planifolia TaxID=51239 RepID=A0A835PQG8_VANPL|nr:hypothetical protein HPP92_024299 [Vanilla planifolia]